MSHPIFGRFRMIASLVLAATAFVHAQNPNLRRPLVKTRIDESRLTLLAGNVRSAASVPEHDRGAVDASLQLDHVLLLLKRSPEAEAALTAYIDKLNDQNSPNYHKWLTAEEIGQQYGPAESDVAALTGWLQSHGLTVNRIYPNGMLVDFSGNARQLEGAFHANLHSLSVNGEAHFANTQDPQIPTALLGVVAGVTSLNDFRPRAMHHSLHVGHVDVNTKALTTEMPGAKYTYASGSSTYQAVVPGDLATIYNLNGLFAGGYSGQGQSIAVIEDTNVYAPANWTTFRTTFGLSGYTAGSFTQVHPGTNCTDPGVNSDATEAILDAEWASAAAPSAAIVLASCADTRTTFGGLIALNNLLSGGNPPKLISISYGESESENGAAANATYYSAYQTAAAAGVSVFVSSGDEGSASSDANLTHATHGITVSGFASTPYNVAVGGTDFGDTAAGSNTQYWNAANTSAYASAKSYIPEIPWNDSCASTLLASANGYSLTYGTNGFCNSSTGQAYYQTTVAGSGGPSGCATGAPSTAGVVSGSCKGYAKPRWQTALNVPADGVRDIPDVSLFAANGAWGHYLVYCDTIGSSSACSGAPSTWPGGGGTSFSAPIMAAIQALINQKTGSAWGNPNPTYYNMAKAEYGSAGNGTCETTYYAVASTTSGCSLYDITSGDLDVVCTGTHNCYLPSGKYGVLSTSNTSYSPAYGTSVGWDFATGIGSVNAGNMAYNWPWVNH